jgi:hypothetical protein
MFLNNFFYGGGNSDFEGSSDWDSDEYDYGYGYDQSDFIDSSDIGEQFSWYARKV